MGQRPRRTRRATKSGVYVSSRSIAPLIAAFVVLAPALAVTGCAQEEDTSIIIAAGHVEAAEVRVSSKVGGVLEWFDLQEGARVEAGQEIGRIDTVDLDLALQSARAEQAVARARFRLSLAGFRAEEINVAAAQVARAEAELEAAGRDLERFETLLERGAGSEKARDDARSRREVAERVVEAARAQLDKLGAGLRDEEIDVARVQVAAVEARIAQLEQQIRDTSIVTPTSGVVTAKLVEPGEILAPGAPLVVVADLESAWLTAFLGEQDLGRVRLRQRARVVTDDGQERAGELIFIDSRAEFTPRNVQTRDERIKLVYRIKVALENADGMYKLGMPAEARFDAVNGGTTATTGAPSRRP